MPDDLHLQCGQEVAVELPSFEAAASSSGVNCFSFSMALVSVVYLSYVVGCSMLE